MSYHGRTFGLLGIGPRPAKSAIDELDAAEACLGSRLPASVREWYSQEDALAILAKHSNDDPPIPVREFEVSESPAGRLIPIRWENQGVCTWAILLDGSDDPPVLVDVDSDGAEWNLLAENFSTYVYSCVWDYAIVLGQPAVVSAQNGPVGDQTLQILADHFAERPRTHGWPGSTQYRFDGGEHGLLLWSSGDQTDWFVGAADEAALEAALRIVWNLDGVGKSLYECSDIAGDVLVKLRTEAAPG